MSIDRGMDTKDAVHTHTGILVSHKKDEILPFATWMDFDSIMLREMRFQTEKDKFHMISLICGI